ncbi:hypothetical protein AY599_21590 [Leptolyngbya valderiana BDU 20041]|nr:hypothetical protein AY599_21590 [Leptolyngbya valderiana BDU 20041]
MRNVGYIRNFDGALHAALDAGHAVEFAIELDKRSPNERPAYERLDEILSGRDGATKTDVGKPKRGDADAAALDEVRAVRDYLRYLDPAFGQSADLKARARRRIRSRWAGLLDRAESSAVRRRLLDRILAFLEAGAPVRAELLEWLRKRAPDLLCVTPLVALGSGQAEYLRAARALGIPTALCVASWDNLTNKGLIHGEPDGVVVWNEAQKREAVELHGQPAEAVYVTGAHSYDHWFDWQPSRPRAEFLREAGLDPERPYLLYLCSSPFIAPAEIDFLEAWLEAVRSADDPALREACVLIRPHPQNPQPWERLQRFLDGTVAVFPQAGDNPVGRRGREIFYDSLHGSALVVGINTSALIEAGILGKAVYTVRHPDHAERQEGTVHFHLLQEVEGGLLTLAPDFPAHLAHLAEALRDPAAGAVKARRFVKGFVRPKGLESACAPLFAAALEAVQSAGPRRVPDRAVARLGWRLLARPLRWLAHREKSAAALARAEGEADEPA